MLKRPKPPRKSQPKEVDFYGAVVKSAGICRDNALKSNDPVEVHKSVVEVDNILKDIADLQNEVGLIRKEIGRHESNLRQANPKGKPKDGDKRVIGGESYIFTAGTWYPLGEPRAGEKE